jgi:hypothetical protein
MVISLRRTFMNISGTFVFNTSERQLLRHGRQDENRPQYVPSNSLPGMFTMAGGWRAVTTKLRITASFVILYC